MPNKKDEARAKEVYDELVRIVESEKLTVTTKDETNFMIIFDAENANKEFSFVIEVLPDFKVVWFRSQLPFWVPVNRRPEMAVAISVLNLVLVDHEFLFDFREGGVYLKMDTGYTYTELSAELLKKMINTGMKSVFSVCDDLSKLAEGKMSLSRFIEEYE